MRRFFLALLAVLLLPYVLTLAWSGQFRGVRERESPGSGRRIYLEEGGYVDAEEFLVGVVARQIPAEYEPEALKAQAVIARTYVFRQMDGAGEVSAGELGLGDPGENSLETLWDKDHFAEYYEKIRSAVEDTAGQVLVCGGELIEPLFHRASAGATRNGDALHPYLSSVDSSFDVEAENYMTVLEWSPEELTGRMNADSAFPQISVSPGQLADTIQIVSKDRAGYVAQIQIGSHIYTGDEVRQLLGLPSSAFTLKDHEGKIRAVCKGLGHGYGLSQYGAHHLAAEGQSAEEILTYYYTGAELIRVESAPQ